MTGRPSQILLIAAIWSSLFVSNLQSQTKLASHSIQIVSAAYGNDGRTCDPRASLAQQCDRRNRCEVMASNSLCGDPNPEVVKALNVDYRCDQGAIKHASAMEYLLIELTCDGDNKLVVSEATVSVPHGQPTMSMQPNCMDKNLQEGADKSSNPQAACKRLCVNLPSTAKVRKVYGFAKESTMEDFLPCQIDSNGTFFPDRQCNIESSVFYPHYQTTADSDRMKVCWTFRNWSLQQARDAKLVVQYEK